MTSIRRNVTLWISLLLIGVAPVLTAGEAVSGQDAFEKLKGLEGTWQGTAQGETEHEGEQGPTEVTHEFRVSANGSVVMETMSPGGEHEMINMYHLDGEDLVLTHYCAGANQPRMKMVEADGKTLTFDFTGGTNLDPAKDGHIHAARIDFVDADTIESTWTPYYEGEPAGQMAFRLTRR